MAEKRIYEGMFLVDAGNPDFDAASQPIHAVLERGEAELLSIKPWDERRLTYEIKGRKRALYVLAYFKMDPGNITELERDVQLNEEIVRALFLRRDELADEVINAETPATTGRRQREEREEREREEGSAEAAPAPAEAPAAEAPTPEVEPTPAPAAAEPTPEEAKPDA